MMQYIIIDIIASYTKYNIKNEYIVSDMRMVGV